MRCPTGPVAPASSASAAPSTGSPTATAGPDPHAEPGVRARLAEPLGDDRAVWVDDADGEEAVSVAPMDPRAEEAPPRVSGIREFGRVLRPGGGPGR